MSDNIFKYFPISREEIEQVENDLLDESIKIQPSKDGLEKLLKATNAKQKLKKYRNNNAQPSSINSLIEILSDWKSISKIELAKIFKVDLSTWSNILSHKLKPNTIEADIYAKIAEMLNVSFEIIKNALLGSYKLYGRISESKIYLRSSTDETAIRNVVSEATELLLHKSLDKEEIHIDEEYKLFINKVEQCMNKKK